MNVTTLIPASDPTRLEATLRSLLVQTMRPGKIIIADSGLAQSVDSTPSRAQTKAAFPELTIDVIQVATDPCATDLERCRPLLQRFAEQQDDASDLFHLLPDASTLDADFYEKHFEAHRTGVIQCAVSQSWTAPDPGGASLDEPLPASIAAPDFHFLAVSPVSAFGLTLGPPTPSNWLGSLSNATFRAAMAKELVDPALEGISFAGQDALGAFLKAASNAPLGFIRLRLGHNEHPVSQASPESSNPGIVQARLAFLSLAIAGRRLGHLTAEQCGVMFANWGSFVHATHGLEPDMADICAILPSLAGGERNAEARFVRLWHDYLAANRLQAR